MYPTTLPRRTSIILALSVTVLSLAAGPTSATTGAGATGLPGYCTQHPVDTSRLPHTADAIAGWFAVCPKDNRHDLR